MVWGLPRKYITTKIYTRYVITIVAAGTSDESERPCAAGIAVEPFWPRTAVLRLHIRRLYNMLLFVVKNISCDTFSWFVPTTKIF